MEVETWKHRSGATVLRVDGGWSDDMAQAIRSESFDGLEVCAGMGSFQGLGAEADKIRWLHAPAVESSVGLETLEQVERITLLREVPQPAFDFRKLPKLRLLESDSGVLLHAPFLNHPALEVLSLDGLAVKDMTFLADARRLRALQLKGSPLKSLTGLEHCAGLTELHVARSRALTDISAVAGLSELEIVEFDGTPNIADISAVYGLKKLKCLLVESHKAKPRDLEWLRGIERLECASIRVESAVIDWRVFAEHPRLYDVTFFTSKEFVSGSDAEILAQLQSAGRTVKTLTRYPKDKFPAFRIEFVPPPDIEKPMPFTWYQNALRYEAKFERN
jgi:hypothetical protein